MDRAARIAFVFAACLAFVMAVVPQPPALPGNPSDKILHVLAFAALGGLAAFGFRASLAVLFLGLAAFGGLIELIQSIPALNRDSEILDLAADMVAALAALVATRWAARALERRP